MIRIGQKYEHWWQDDTVLHCEVISIEGDKVQVEQYSHWNHVMARWTDNPKRYVEDWRVKDFGDGAFWHESPSSMIEDRMFG